MRAPERVRLIHIVATPAAIESAVWPDETVVLPIAPDAVLALSSTAPEMPGDPFAIVHSDDGYAGVWLPASEAQALLSSSCEWELPTARPAFAQGAVAGLPVKLWIENNRVLILVAAPYAVELAERLS